MIFRHPADLASQLTPFRRLLGLDVGEKTIGLAVSDLTRTIATPLHTIRRTKFTTDVAELLDLVRKEDIAALVIGYPVNMDGSEGPRCQSIRAFCANLEKHFTLPILLWDERMSTQAVTRAMLEADLSRARRADMVDKAAAAYILQGVLDSLSRQSTVH